MSIGSIKRAEAGKNVLYRTVSSLAYFFNVSVAALIDEVPNSLWEYSTQQYPEITPCLGRTYELSQLQLLHQLSAKSRQSACIYGASGVGKTNLISHFLRATNEGRKYSLYVCAMKERPFLAHLIRVVLNLSEQLDDDRIRLTLNKIVQSPPVYFHLLKLMGLPLSRAETAALEGLTSKRRNDTDVLALMVLIQSLKERNTAILVIDGLQNLDSREIAIVQRLIQHTQSLPIFILLAATYPLLSSPLACVLQSAYLIPLKSLDDSAMTAVADSIPFSCPINGNPNSHKANAISRSQGNPRILKALLMSPHPVPPELVQMVQKRITTLNSLETKLLYFLVSIGQKIDIDEIDQYLDSCRLTGIHQLNTLVSAGFLVPLADAYQFQYKVIWEALRVHVRQERANEVKSLHQAS
ncbi:AAA family ATPase [Vibrio ostreicida]|uniref:AAA family ATPase n=1 Tax=Vibrio ostreicida TaxID=526588 RepID=UPI003B5B14A5